MKTRLAVLLSVSSCFFAGGLLAEEHKAEKKPEAKAEHKAEPKKEAKAEAKHDAKPAAKPEASHTAAPAHEAKPSPAPAAHAAPAPAVHRAPVRAPARPIARAARPRAASPAPTAARPAAPQAPIVVQVKQEPARVEAVLHVVPYGQGPGVPAFAGSGYGTTGPYTIAAYPMDQAPPQPQASAPPPADPANNYAPVQVAQNYPQQPYAPPQPSYAPAAYSAPSGPPPIRNVMRAPKNALTNEGLVTLAQVGYDEDFILDLMRQKNCRFDTSVEGLAYMATHGLTERIVKAALKAEADNLLAQQLEARR